MSTSGLEGTQGPPGPVGMKFVCAGCANRHDFDLAKHPFMHSVTLDTGDRYETCGICGAAFRGFYAMVDASAVAALTVGGEAVSGLVVDGHHRHQAALENLAEVPSEPPPEPTPDPEPAPASMRPAKKRRE